MCVLLCTFFCVCPQGWATVVQNSTFSPKIRVVTRPPVHSMTPAPPVPEKKQPASPARTAPLPPSSDSVAVYRKIGADGTVYLTNRPDGDSQYQFFGHFSAVRLMQTLGPEGVRRLAERYATQYGVDARLILAIIRTESGFDSTARSPAGAQGLMQLMPKTQQDLGVQDAFNPAENIEGGVRYFRAMLDRYQGDTVRALAAYNAGPANVDKYGGVPPFDETQRYVQLVLRRAGER